MKIAGIHIESVGLLAKVLAVLAIASPLHAGPVGDTGSFTQTRQSGYYAGNGGEFTIYNFGNVLNTSGYTAAASNIGNFDPSFQTFCLETSEYATSPSYFQVGTAAVAGGGEAVNGSDTISVGTAWLYTQFANGTLSGYFGGNRSTQAGLLQQAIWWLEGEDGNQDLTSNLYYAAAVNYFGGKVAAETNATAGYMGVYVLNNYSDAARTQKAQDFLYRVPDGGTTLMLLGGSLMGLSVMRRRLGR